MFKRTLEAVSKLLKSVAEKRIAKKKNVKKKVFRSRAQIYAIYIHTIGCVLYTTT